MKKSKNNHLKSVTHKILDESNICRYFNFNPFINEIDEIMKKYIITYNKFNNFWAVVY